MRAVQHGSGNSYQYALCSLAMEPVPIPICALQPIYALHKNLPSRIGMDRLLLGNFHLQLYPIGVYPVHLPCIQLGMRAGCRLIRLVAQLEFQSLQFQFAIADFVRLDGRIKGEHNDADDEKCQTVHEHR